MGVIQSITPYLHTFERNRNMTYWKKRWGKVPHKLVQEVKEGLDMGWTYDDIRQATGVGLTSIARIKQETGRTRRRGVPKDVLAAVQEAVEMGMSYTEIRSGFGVSAGTIARVKRSMGLLDADSNTELDEPGAPYEQPEPTPRLVKAIGRAMGERDYWEGTASELLALIDSRKQGIPKDAIRLSTVLGTPHMIDALKTAGIAVERYRSGSARSILLTRSGITAPQEESQQAEPTYTPQQYFEAISHGIAEYHRHLAVLEDRIEELTQKNKDLHDAFIQARAKIGTWVGPTQIPNRNMSTGG